MPDARFGLFVKHLFYCVCQLNARRQVFADTGQLIVPSSSLRAHDIAGVTVYRGILGYGANRRIHKDATLSLSHDRPILLSVVDTEEKLQAFMPILDQMVQQGLVVLSNVDIVKYSHNYQKAERRQETRI